MAFFPDIDDIVVQESTIGKDFVFENGQHILNADGTVQECDDLGGLKNWIMKVVKTQVGAYEVYTRDENEKFGVSIYEELGTKDRAYWLSECKREITEQLEKHEFIDRVEAFNAELEKRKVVITFTVVTTDDIDIEERIVV